MKLKHFIAALYVCCGAHAVSAQAPVAPTPPTPPSAPTPPVAITPPTPPTAPEAPAAVVPPAPPAAPTQSVVDGTLFGTQRVTGERGQFQWICTYRVGGQKRMVQLDESCPSTLPFQIRK